jgi:polyisoprenoid-binding protein YceI
MTERYRFNPSQGRFTVQAFAAGLLSAFAHSPTFAVRDYRGELRFEGGQANGLGLDLTARADSLDLLDKVSASDRHEIDERMRRDVLDIAAFPEIRYQAEDVPAELIGPGEFRLRVGGRLTLHGATQPRPVDATLQVFKDAVLLRGSCPLRLSDHRIQPVTALGGTIKLKDELRVVFELYALPEEP